MKARPDHGVEAIFLEDGCLVFSEPRQEIHALNTSAAFIWLKMEEGADSAAIVVQLGETFGLAEGEAADYVRLAMADWRVRGLLADSPVRECLGIIAAEVPAAIPPYPDLGLIPATERSYVLLGTRLRIRFATREQADLVHPVLAHLETKASTADVVLDVVSRADQFVLYRDREGSGVCSSSEELAPLVKGLVWTTAVNRHDFFLGIHAGVVVGPSGAVLLPGRSGSGKSSLTAALVHAGWDYFSDEMALLRDGDLRVLPVPFALCVKETGIGLLAGRYPELRDLPMHRRADGKRVAYLPPPLKSLCAAETVCPVQAVIFPHYVAGTTARLKPVPRAKALGRLLGECLAVRKLDAARVRTLARWIAKVDCFDLVLDDLAEAASAISDVVLGNGMGGPAEAEC